MRFFLKLPICTFCCFLFVINSTPEDVVHLTPNLPSPSVQNSNNQPQFNFPSAPSSFAATTPDNPAYLRRNPFVRSNTKENYKSVHPMFLEGHSYNTKGW